MKLVIAEKPTVKDAVKDMLENMGEKFTNDNRVWVSKNYMISNFFGHLYEAKLPQELDPKFEDWNNLPILPDSLSYKVKPSGAAQAKLLTDLASKCESIICITDPDAEGEGIFRIWYNVNRIKLPVERVMPYSLEPKDMIRQWNQKSPISHYNTLADTQKGRSWADWVVGMNGSRAYSVKADGRFSIGRVQTPVLRMIVERDQQVENYKESFSYRLSTVWHSLKFTYKDEFGVSKFENNNLPAEIQKLCVGKFKITKFESKQGKKNPPITYALIDVQKDAAKRFGYDLKKTLDIVQVLYEKYKAVTYPRTDSGYLPSSGLDRYHSLVRACAIPKEVQYLIPPTETPGCVQDTDAAHTGIIPTGAEFSKMSEEEENVYELIRSRFVTAFMKPAVVLNYSIAIGNGTVDLSHSSTAFVEKNWVEILEKEKDEDESECEEIVPLVKESELIPAELEKSDIEKLKSAKPKYYDAASLVQAMKSASRRIEDKELAKELQKGIGTPATRQTIPDDLIRKGYVRMEKKYYVSTEKGRGLIAVVDPEVSSPVMTAEWEKKLSLIEAGKLSVADFMQGIGEYVSKRLIHVSDAAKDIKTNPEYETVGVCPVCGEPVKEFIKAFGCSAPTCSFLVYKEMYGKKLPKQEVKNLLSKKITGTISGFVSKAKSKYDAQLELTAEHKIVLKFETEPKKSVPKPVDLSCPKCGSAMEQNSKTTKCSNCQQLYWNTLSGLDITGSMKALLSGTEVFLKGFISQKTNKKFDAKVVLSSDKSKFEFRFGER